VRDIVRPLVARLAKDGLAPGAFRRAQPDAAPKFFRALGVPGEKFESLPVEEKQLIASVRERVMDDPRVKQAASTAETAEKSARPPALRALRQTTRQVALEIEPGIGPVLAKLGEPGPGAE
jgi:hypothetical protein